MLPHSSLSHKCSLANYRVKMNSLKSTSFKCTIFRIQVLDAVSQQSSPGQVSIVYVSELKDDSGLFKIK